MGKPPPLHSGEPQCERDTALPSGDPHVPGKGHMLPVSPPWNAVSPSSPVLSLLEVCFLRRKDRAGAWAPAGDSPLAHHLCTKPGSLSRRAPAGTLTLLPTAVACERHRGRGRARRGGSGSQPGPSSRGLGRARARERKSMCSSGHVLAWSESRSWGGGGGRVSGSQMWPSCSGQEPSRPRNRCGGPSVSLHSLPHRRSLGKHFCRFFPQGEESSAPLRGPQAGRPGLPTLSCAALCWSLHASGPRTSAHRRDPRRRSVTPAGAA